MQFEPDPLTETQRELIADMDDVNEHVFWEFDPDDYVGMSTCGMAHVANISGNGSFVRRVKSLADTNHDGVYEHRNGGYMIEIAGLSLSLSKNHDSGYRLSITNTQEICHGPNFQRMDAQERLHRLLLERLQYNGYCLDAYVSSRID